MIKHIVATRFLAVPMGYTEEQLFSDELFNARLTTLKNNLIPSLKNQSCKCFTFVVLIYDKLPKNLRLRLENTLKEAKLPFSWLVLEYGKRKDYIKSIYKEAKYLVLSRIDDDDFVFNDGIADTQRNVYGTCGVRVYGYCRGYTYIENDDKIYSFEHYYGGNGMIAILESVIINTDTVNSEKISLFSFNHTKPKEYFKSIGLDAEIVQNKTEAAFIWYRHKHNDSLQGKNLPKWAMVKYAPIASVREEFEKKFAIKF